MNDPPQLCAALETFRSRMTAAMSDTNADFEALKIAGQQVVAVLCEEMAQGKDYVLQELYNMCHLPHQVFVRMELVESGVVPILVDQLEGPLQTKCLRLIRVLSLLEQGRDKLVACGAVQMIVRYLRSPDREISGCALRTIFNLSVVNEQIRMDIVNAGALPLLLIAALEQGDGQCAAIGTLANLATETDIKRAIVQNYGGLEPLLRLLENPDESILTHACRALFAIAANDANKVAIAEAGGLPLLLACMDSQEDAVRMNAAGALANLAIHPLNKIRLVQHGALAKLRVLAYSANQKIQRQVARCLFALAAQPENRRAIIDEGCLRALVRLLHSQSVDVQLNAAGAVGNIAMTDDFKSEVVSSGALDRLVSLLAERDERVPRQVARAIFTLTAKDVAKKRLAVLNGLPQLIQLTQHTNEDIQRDAAGALANMAIGSEHKDRIVRMGGLLPLIALLSSPNQHVQRQSARAIFALAGNEENQRAILRHEGLKPLVGLLDSKNHEVQKHACGAIANLSNDHQHAVVQHGALETLVRIIMDHPSLEVRRQAARAMDNLSTQSQRFTNTTHVGVQGEVHRLRQSMRRLFVANSALAINSAAKERTCEQHTLPPCSYLKAVCKTGSATGTGTVPVTGTETGTGIADRLAALGVHLRTLRKTASALEPDVCLILPIAQDAGAAQPSLENESEASGTAVDGGDLESPCDNFLIFRAHSAILFARWELLANALGEVMQLASEELVTSGTVSPSLITPEGLLVVYLPPDSARSTSVWLAFLEYLYTDLVRENMQALRERARAAAELADFAMECKMPQLSSLCCDLNAHVNSVSLAASKQDREGKSTWAADMSKLLTDKSPLKSALSDVVMRCADQSQHSLNVHKFMLAARCSYFKAIFGGNMDWSDSATEAVVFNGSKESLDIIVRYIYCGLDVVVCERLVADASLALQILVISNEYNLDGLQLYAERLLMSHINQESVPVLMCELELIHAPLLRSVCILYIIKEILAPLRSSQCTEETAMIDLIACKINAWGLPDAVRTRLAAEIFHTAQDWGFKLVPETPKVRKRTCSHSPGPTQDTIPQKPKKRRLGTRSMSSSSSDDSDSLVGNMESSSTDSH